MIRNPSIVRSFEHELARREPADYRRNLRIFEALYAEARFLGVIPLKNVLDGIDADIRMAGVLNDRGVALPDRGRT
jgi:hypothetical protein